MKAGGLRVAFQTAVVAIFMPAVAHADDIDHKLELCRNCHGSHLQGFIGYYAAPRLAGLPEQYLQNEFQGMRNHKRDNPLAKRFMWPIVTHGSTNFWDRMAKRISQMDAPPAADGPKNLVAKGKTIFEAGIPEDNIPACAACHGENAQGMDSVARLAGQLYVYLVAEMIEWQKGYRAKDPVSDEPNTMQPIAHSLTSEQIKAVASYLSYQK
jgi:cytochrome c553